MACFQNTVFLLESADLLLRLVYDLVHTLAVPLAQIHLRPSCLPPSTPTYPT